MDIHNPYSGYCIETFAGAVLPWHEKLERTKKFEIVPPVKVNSNSSFNFNAKVHFEERIYIVLIPSRNDTKNYSEDIWWTEDEINKSKLDAESELKLSLSSNESCLTLYSAMNLLYRPCSQQSGEKRNKNHFRILIVDDSLVSRKMTMFNIAQGHRSARTKELLFLQQAPDYEAAKECIFSKEYNVIIIDDNLSKPNKSCWCGNDLVPIIRGRSPNCIIIGMSSELSDVAKTKQITNMFMRAGK
jgi:hypothetical protein